MDLRKRQTLSPAGGLTQDGLPGDQAAEGGAETGQDGGAVRQAQGARRGGRGRTQQMFTLAMQEGELILVEEVAGIFRVYGVDYKEVAALQGTKSPQCTLHRTLFVRWSSDYRLDKRMIYRNNWLSRQYEHPV